MFLIKILKIENKCLQGNILKFNNFNENEILRKLIGFVFQRKLLKREKVLFSQIKTTLKRLKELSTLLVPFAVLV